jgi:hypothetical protein
VPLAACHHRRIGAGSAGLRSHQIVSRVYCAVAAPLQPEVMLTTLAASVHPQSQRGARGRPDNSVMLQTQTAGPDEGPGRVTVTTFCQS